MVIPGSLQRQALEQIHVNHMGIEKTKLLACELICKTGMNNEIEKIKLAKNKNLLYMSGFSANTAK